MRKSLDEFLTAYKIYRFRREPNPQNFSRDVSPFLPTRRTAAELGSVKMREEIDALSTMGLDPVEVLILPRIIALICALPILSFIGSMAGLYGGGLVAQLYGDMGPAIYIARLHEAVSVTSFKGRHHQGAFSPAARACA